MLIKWSLLQKAATTKASNNRNSLKDKLRLQKSTTTTNVELKQ